MAQANFEHGKETMEQKFCLGEFLNDLERLGKELDALYVQTARDEENASCDGEFPGEYILQRALCRQFFKGTKKPAKIIAAKARSARKLA